MKIAYTQTHFPVISQTFVANEVRAVKALGADVTVFALMPGPVDEPRHPDLDDLEDSVVFVGRSRAAMLRDLLAVCARPRSWRGVGRALALTVVTRDFLNLRLLGPAASIARSLASGIDHLHAHFAHVPAVLADLVAALIGERFSFTAHAHDIYRAGNNAELRKLCADAAFIIVPSHSAKLELLSRAGSEPAQKINVIRNGIDVEAFRVARRPDPNVIVSVARLVAYKGIDTLIEACARLRGKGVDLRCELVGDGDERARLEELVAERDLDGSVTFHGAQPAPFVRDLLGRATIFALCARIDERGLKDTLPVAVTEAMAAGVPVVASSIAGIPEVVRDGETGILVGPDDPQALADALGRLLTDDELRRRLAANARSLVEREFDQRRTAAEVFELFERVADG